MHVPPIYKKSYLVRIDLYMKEGLFEPLSLLPPFGPGIIGYDRNNRVIGISFTSPEGTDNPVRLSYMYDADGNRLSSSVAGTGGIRRTKLYCGRYEYEVTMGMPRMVEDAFLVELF